MNKEAIKLFSTTTRLVWRGQQNRILGTR